MKVILVTGSNKGIGRGIVETLCKQLSKNEWKVYMTARNEELGLKTVDELKSMGLTANFHQLDIDCETSRKNLKEYLQNKYGGLDVLINNAGIAFKVDSTAPVSEQAQVTLKTNFFNTLRMCQEFIPILKQDARLVNVSSMVSKSTLSKLGQELYKKFTGPMSITELENLMSDFVKCAAEGNLEQHGWPAASYGVSKIGVTKMTSILAKDFKDDPRNILMNSCCPGYVDTDMTSHKGHKTIYEGAETPIYLALLPVGVDGPSGEYFSDKTRQDWK